MTEDTQTADILDMTVGIVANYLSNNRLDPDQVGALITATHAALSGLGQTEPAPEPVETYVRASSAQVRKSMTDEGLVSFIDGKTYKTLRRHLATNGITPDEYRDRYGLPSTYPMVAAAYSAKRSEMAKAIGLGAKGRKPQPDATTPSQTRGRPRK